MRSYLFFLLPCWLVAASARPAAAAPVVISANQAASPPREEAGTGVCATAVHLSSANALTSADVARFYLSQSPGMSTVDGKSSTPSATINFTNGIGGAMTDYADPIPLPFSPGAASPGNGLNTAMRVRGYVNIKRAGIYTFGVNADDGYSFSIAGVQIMQSSFTDVSLRDSRQVQFAATGLYALDLVYFQKNAAGILDLARSDGEDIEVTATSTPLPATFRLLEKTELFSAVAGTSSCAECTEDAACGVNMGQYCRDGLCQRCILSARCGLDCRACPSGRPACVDMVCEECGPGDTRLCDDKGQICVNSRCAACTADAQCGTGKICDTAFGQCIPRPEVQYGGGCSVGPRPGGGGTGGGTEAGAGVSAVAAALLGLLLFTRGGRRVLRRLARAAPDRGAAPPRPRAALLALAVLLLPALLPADASAQTNPTPPVSFNAQTFRPALGPGNVFTVEGTLMPPRLRPLGGVLFEYAHQPLRLVIQGSGETYAATVPAMVTAHVMPGFAITRFLSVALDLPVVLYQGFDSRTPTSDAPATPAVAGVGDLRLMTKFRIVNNESGGFGLAAVPQFSFPTGSATSFRGDDTVGIEPRLAADYRFKSGVFIALNVGYWLRTYNRTVDFGLVRVADQLRYGLGIGAPIAKGFGLAGELVGAASFSKLEGGPTYAPLEGYLGARYTHTSGVELTAGGGGAFLSAVGSAGFRVFAGIAYVPRARPRAVRSPEPRDTEAPRSTTPVGEPVSPPAGEPARPGVTPVAPDPDGDGVLGRADLCPGEAGPATAQGCPDQDGDGIPDRSDKCPAQAGVARTGGCPEIVDTDKDGVPDAADKCPGEPGIADNAGCPDVDTDKDGIVDRLDKCPSKAGPPGGTGCPLIQVGETTIKLSQPIRFMPSAADLDPASLVVVAALGKVVSDDESIKQVRISVPASGDRRTVKRLGQSRTKTLTQALLDQGVGKKQLQIKPLKKASGDEITEIEIKTKKGRRRHGDADAADKTEEKADKPGRHHRRHRGDGDETDKPQDKADKPGKHHRRHHKK